MIRFLRRGWNRLAGSIRGPRADADLAAEFDSHIEMLTEDNVRRGLCFEEARRQARLTFGNIESGKESYRDQRGWRALETVLQDLRHGVRGMRRNPGFTAVAMLSLGIGIGACTAIFSVVNAVILRPMAYDQPDRIFAVREVIPQVAGNQSIPANPLHAREWREHCPSLAEVGLMRWAGALLTGGGEPEMVRGLQVTHNVFRLFGVRPILGRTFLPEEEQEGRHRVVILSETVWRRRFNADPAIVGKRIVLNDENYDVAGIVPGSFQLPYAGDMEPTAPNVHFEAFRPLVVNKGQLRPMGNFNYSAVVRLKPGATERQAAAEMNTVQARFPPQAGEKVDLKVAMIPIQELVVGRSRLGLWMLLAAVGAVLLIVCVNLANLVLSRIASRERESAIRKALGASRARLFGQSLIESMLVAASGGALGIAGAGWILNVLTGMATLDIPRLAEVRLDPAVLAFSVLVTTLTGLLVGTLPAWRVSRHNPQEALRAGSHTVAGARGGLRVREALIGIEVGLSAALLILAGLLTLSLTRLLGVEKGFDTEQIVTARIALTGKLYADAPNRDRFFGRLRARLETIPGFRAAGLVTHLPSRGATWIDPIYLEGDTRPVLERPLVNNRYASPGYFASMGIAIRQGRDFAEQDRQPAGVSKGVAILSEKAAGLLWPGARNLVGRRFVGEDDAPKTVVAIVADVRASLHEAAPPTVYYPYWQRTPSSVSVVLRTAGGPRPSASALRAAIRAEDAQVPVMEIQTMDEVIGESVAQRRFQLTLVLVFAGAAVVVAGIGIYGVVSYAVARRRNELGVRMALGAQPGKLLRLVIRQAMTPVAIGLAGGVCGALLLARVIRGLLFGIQPLDPLTIVAVVGIVLAVGALSCVFPARRAATMNVIDALRFE